MGQHTPDHYAAALSDFGDTWIEFYFADDAEHAHEQAEDANPSAEILAIALNPYTVIPNGSTVIPTRKD